MSTHLLHADLILYPVAGYWQKIEQFDERVGSGRALQPATVLSPHDFSVS
jgi:hypothetical protein